MSDVLTSFFDQQSEEDKQNAQAAVSNAKSEQSIKLETSGRYLMEVASFAFKDKETHKMRTSPELVVSEKKKSLMLSINLKVVDGTPQAPKGSSLFANIVLSPAAGASQEKFDNTMRMMKPQVVALTGEEKIEITPKWIDEYLMATFETEDNGSYKMIKDHKMKNKVMVVVEDDIYNGKPTLNVKSIIKAVAGDKSVSNMALAEENPKELAGSGDVDSGDVNPEEALLTGEDSSDGADVPDLPAEPDDF